MLNSQSQQSADRPRVRAAQQRQKSRGQSMVEFALLLPILVTILAIAADFGRAFTAYIEISSAAREGAAAGMMSGSLDDVEAAVLDDIGNGGSIWGTDVDVFPSMVNDDGQGYQQVVVRVEYTFTPVMPVPGLPSDITMERTVKMRVLN
jgi:Flp pilus assembly protein TadG